MEVIDGGGVVIIGKGLFFILVATVTGLAFLWGMAMSSEVKKLQAPEKIGAVKAKKGGDDGCSTSSDRRLDIEC